MKKFYQKVMDTYFAFPIIGDLAIAILCVLVNKHISLLKFRYLDKAAILNFITSIIGTYISLAGFILAALTIIVSFKSNSSARGDAPQNGFAVFMIPKNYNAIIKFFKAAIIEFLMISVILYVIYIFSADLSLNNLMLALPPSITLMILTLWRSLFILFSIMKVESIENQ